MRVDKLFDAEHLYKSPSPFSDMMSVVPTKLSLPILCEGWTSCMLVTLEMKPPGLVTDMCRALPPVEVHCTLNVPSVGDSTTILADTDLTVVEINQYNNMNKASILATVEHHVIIHVTLSI